MSAKRYITAGPIPDAQNDGIKVAGFSLSNITQGGTIVSAVAGKRIFIHGMTYSQIGSNSSIQWQDLTTAGATIATNGAGLQTAANTPVTIPFSQYPWFTCAPGDSFGMATPNAGTISVGGSVMYVQG